MSTVLEITNNPGIIATELCKKWSRTRSAISQLLKKLERKDLIYREKEKGEDKIVHLYPTVEGIKLRNVVVMNESSDTTQLFHDLLRKGCTQQDLESFYKVIGCYTQELLERPGSNWSNLIPEIGE